VPEGEQVVHCLEPGNGIAQLDRRTILVNFDLRYLQSILKTEKFLSRIKRVSINNASVEEILSNPPITVIFQPVLFLPIL
jgi:hypothetical protein